MNTLFNLEELHLYRKTVFRDGPVPWFPLLDTIEYQKAVRKKRPSVFRLLSSADRLLIQPRSGVSDHGAMKAQTQRLEQAGADIATVTIDSQTRLLNWDAAARGHKLNGYPLPTRGIGLGRDLVNAVDTAVECRHGSPNGCLLAETALASGMSSFEGGGISYNLPYCKDVPLEESLANYRYVDRLTAVCSPPGDPIDRESFGTLTGVLTPPSIAIAISVLELAMAVEQGVDCFTLGLPETGHLAQDVAMIQVARAVSRQFLTRLGLRQPRGLFTSFHQWMGVFPRDRRLAIRTIGYGVIAAALAGATKLINKTYEEALGIPSPEANATSIRYCRSLSEFCLGLHELQLPEARILEEREILSREVGEILDAVCDLGTANLAEAVSGAFRKGLLDLPFPASRSAFGRIIPARDGDGAIRFSEHGGLPFSHSTVAYHRQRLAAGPNESLEADVFYVRDGRHLANDTLRALILAEFESLYCWEQRICSA